jgi:hypothetical protein
MVLLLFFTTCSQAGLGFDGPEMLFSINHLSLKSTAGILLLVGNPALGLKLPAVLQMN